jgi:hypothetical protein
LLQEEIMIRALLATLVLAVTLLPVHAGADELTAIIQTDLQTLGYEPGGTDGEMTVQTAIAISKFQAENSLDVTGEASPQLAGVIKAALKNGGQLPPQAQPAAAAAPQAAPAESAQAQQGSAFGAIAGVVAPSMAQGMVSGATGIDPAMLQALMGGESPQQSAQMSPEDMQAMQAQIAQMMGGATGVDPAMIQAVQAEAMQQQAAQAQQACLQQKIAEAQAAQESQQRRRGFGSLMRAVSRLGGDEISASVAEASAEVANANAAINDLESAARDLGLTEDDVASCGAAQ